MSQGKRLLLRKSRKVAEGRGDLGALPHVLPPVHPRDELHSLPLPEGGKATGRSQICGLPNQSWQ